MKNTIKAGGWQVQGQPGLHRATLSHKTTKSNVLTELRESTTITKLGQYTANKKERAAKKKALGNYKKKINRNRAKRKR